MTDFLNKIKKKDSKSIQLLYERFGKKLYGYATVRWHVSEDDSWELVYKTLYKFMEVVERYSFENEGKLQAFIFQSFINNLRNLYNEKKSKQQTVIFLEELNPNKLSEEMKDEESPKQNNPYMICLKKILEQLDDWKRILLLMRAQDYSYEEITNYVNKPEDQLKVYYMRSKKMVTEKVNECVKNS